MRHSLEWTHAFNGRLKAEAAAAVLNNTSELTAYFAAELAAGHLPCLALPFKAELEEQLAGLEPLLSRFKHMLLLGIGGSALGARALQKAFFPAQDRPGHQGPWLWIADNVDAASFDALLDSLPPQQTLVVAISKSGGTIETISQYFMARQWLRQKLGSSWNEHMIAVTDENNGFLREEARQHSLASLPVPDYLGGRYSVLSAVGLLPAAFMGMDWRGLLAGAHSTAAPLLANPASLARYPVTRLAAWNLALEQTGYSELIFFSYIPLWATLGPWFCQLWAESLGKQGRGTMPLSAVGVTDQHSVNQMFLDGPRNKACLFLTAGGLARGRSFDEDLPQRWAWLKGKRFGELLDAEALGTRMALAQSATPLLGIHMADSSEKAAGALMLLLEATTLVTGWLMGINPVDQPAVELGKRLANARLGAPGYVEEEAALGKFLAMQAEREEF